LFIVLPVALGRLCLDAGDIDLPVVGGASGIATAFCSSEPVELLRRAQVGDGVAFAELYVQFFDPIRRLLLRALGNREDAEDAAQEVFRKAFEALSRYDEGCGAFRSWLFQIARNQAIDHQRKRAHEDVRDPDVIARHQDSVASRVSGVMSRIDPDHGLATLIAELPRSQQRVLGLRYVFEMTAVEIGDVLGASADSIRHLQHRALRSLATSLVT
jgi:RNA polymerase sigma-70 factor (ECF subfamily)